MRLIPMTDFVISQFENETDPILSEKKMFDYANFLKQTLNLGMFVPCDLKGNFLEIPTYNSNLKELEEAHFRYQQAKERVIFDGFEYDKKGFAKKGDFYVNEEFIINKTIEDIIKLL